MSDLESMKRKMAALSGKRGRAAVKVPDTSLTTVMKKSDRSRAARKSKNKGSSFERAIAKKIGAWSGERLRRTPQSGGWGGAVAHGVSGDLVCDRRAFPFHIECKNREGWLLDDLIIGVRQSDTRSVLMWWKQTITTCPPGKTPMLVFTKNHAPDFLMLKHTDFYKLSGKDFTAEFIPHYVFAYDLDTVVIMALDDFLVKIRPPRGCRARKTWNKKNDDQE